MAEMRTTAFLLPVAVSVNWPRSSVVVVVASSLVRLLLRGGSVGGGGSGGGDLANSGGVTCAMR